MRAFRLEMTLALKLKISRMVWVQGVIGLRLRKVVRHAYRVPIL
jgi:hypothetical protein